MKKCEHGKYLKRRKNTRTNWEKKNRHLESYALHLYDIRIRWEEQRDRETKRQRNKKANSNKVKRKFEKRGKIAFIVKTLKRL